MGLGALHTVSLSEAREKALECRKLRLNGSDPLDVRRASKEEARLAALRVITFKSAAESYIASHRASWRNEKHAEQWTSTLEAYAFPSLGAMALSDIDVAAVMRVLQPIWSTKTETASRLRGRIEAILNWAKAQGFRDGENPARWRGHLDHLLPARAKVQKVVHHAALPYPQMPRLFDEIGTREGVSAEALQFLILTAARTSEVLQAEWVEFDVGNRLWTIPAERMKAGREHRVPLSVAAIDLLQLRKKLSTGAYVFQGAKKGRPLSNMALLVLLRRMKRGDLTAHGFRSTFRDWVAETTTHSRDVAEMALAHTVSDKVEAAYRRGDLFEKRRALMADWANFCLSKRDRTCFRVG